MKAKHGLYRAFRKPISGACRGQKQTCTRVSPLDPNLLPPIYKVSADVINNLIAPFLPLSNAAALALTCRSLWWTLDGRRTLAELRKDKESLLDLLERMEVDFPNHILCYPCAVFHLRPSNGVFTPRTCDKAVGELSHLLPIFRLPYRKVKECMNYHRFGRKHGNPLSWLQKDLRYTAERDFRVLYSISAKVVRRAFILKEDISYLFRKDNLNAKDRSLLQACYSTMHAVRGLHVYPRLLEETESISLSKCNTCSSEMRLLLDSNSNKQYGEIRRTTWLNLGDCHSGVDPQWKSVVDGCPREGYQQAKKLIYPRHFDDTSPSLL